MPKIIDLTGQRFGKLTVINITTKRKAGSCIWHCRCDCGNTIDVNGRNLRDKQTASCGCNRYIPQTERLTKHGKRYTKTYAIWCGIIQRVTNPNNSAYRYYGGRGIKVCNSWLNSFENFLKDMGEAPPGLTIERINNDGDYEPNNCRWASKKEQCQNRVTSKVLYWRGQSKTVAEWSEIVGLPAKLIYSRISNGWDVQKTLTTPKQR